MLDDDLLWFTKHELVWRNKLQIGLSLMLKWKIAGDFLVKRSSFTNAFQWSDSHSTVHIYQYCHTLRLQSSLLRHTLFDEHFQSVSKIEVLSAPNLFFKMKGTASSVMLKPGRLLVNYRSWVFQLSSFSEKQRSNILLLLLSVIRMNYIILSRNRYTSF